jgi:hypothetical protein
MPFKNPVIGVTNKPAILASVTLNQDGGIHAYGTFDVSSYLTLRWQYRAFDPSTTAGPGTAIHLILFAWYDATGTIQMGYDYIHCLSDNGRNSGFEFSFGAVRVKGPRMFVNIDPPNVAGGTAAFQLLGSFRDIQKNHSWLGNGWYGFEANTSVASAIGLDRYVSIQTTNLASLASDSVYFPTRTGWCTLEFAYSNAVPANGIDFLIKDQQDNQIVGGFNGVGGGAGFYQDSFQMIMPDRPLWIFMRNRGPAALTTGLAVTMAWEGE